MLRTLSLFAFALSAILLLDGCTSSYVDPVYKDVTMADLKAPQQRYRIRLTTEFQTNGSPNSYANRLFRQRVEEALNKTGVVQIVADNDSGPAAGMHLVMNNVGNLGDAAAKGFGTGLTFGLVGSLVTDGYEFLASYTPTGGSAISRNYKHAIHTTIGNAEGPSDLPPLSVDAAFERVVSDLVMVFVRDLQQQGLLTRIDTGQLWRQTALLHVRTKAQDRPGRRWR